MIKIFFIPFLSHLPILLKTKRLKFQVGGLQGFVFAGKGTNQLLILSSKFIV